MPLIIFGLKKIHFYVFRHEINILVMRLYSFFIYDFCTRDRIHKMINIQIFFKCFALGFL